MNDFTKEELELILSDVIEQDITSSRSIDQTQLKYKIQSLIDNYCEHDGEIGKDYPGEKCMKCNRMWE